MTPISQKEVDEMGKRLGMNDATFLGVLAELHRLKNAAITEEDFVKFGIDRF